MTQEQAIDLMDIALGRDAPAPGVLYLIGYGAAAPDTFFGAVAAVNPDICLDIRLKPWGWHERYRGPRFLADLRAAGAREVRHDQRLGNPGHFDDGGMRLADERALAPLAVALAAGQSVMVVCGCGRGEGCHRSLVAKRLADQVPGLEVRELGPLPSARATGGV
jgi:hypothetical protein